MIFLKCSTSTSSVTMSSVCVCVCVCVCACVCVKGNDNRNGTSPTLSVLQYTGTYACAYVCTLRQPTAHTYVIDGEHVTSFCNYTA